MVHAWLNPRAVENKLAVLDIIPQPMVVVPRRRLELPRPNGHWHLKPARLPIPPPGHIFVSRWLKMGDFGETIALYVQVSNLFKVYSDAKYAVHDIPKKSVLLNKNRNSSD